MALDADVVIVGAGPAGASTALHLLHAAPRLRVLILERHRWPREKICAGAVGGRALKALAKIGVRPSLPAKRIVHGLGVVTGQGRQSGRHPHAIGWVVQRRDFDACLIEAALERGAQLRDDARVVGVRCSRALATVETPRGGVRARAVVGADGVSSVVRRHLGVPAAPAYAQAVEVDTRVRAEDADADILWFDVCDPTLPGYAWDFARPDVDGRPVMCRGIYQLVQGCPGAGRHPEPGHRLRARLEAQGLPCEPHRFRRYAEQGISLAAPLARPRCILVGEAAGIDPVLGEGIAQAILGGAVAGPYLAQALAADELSFTTWADAFSRSRVGIDLRARTAALNLVYDGRWSGVRDRWFARSTSLAATGAAYYGGHPFPWRSLGRSLLDLGRAAAATESGSRSSRACT